MQLLNIKPSNTKYLEGNWSSCFSANLSNLSDTEAVACACCLCEDVWTCVDELRSSRPTALMSLTLRLNILCINLVMSTVNSMLTSLRSHLQDADYRDLTNVIKLSDFLFSDAMDYSLLTTEHRDDIIAVKRIVHCIRDIQGLETRNPFVNEMFSGLSSLERKLENCEQAVTERRGYTVCELRCVSCTTVDAICAMSLLLVNGAKLFNYYIPEYTDYLQKWIETLYSLMESYPSIPLTYKEPNDTKPEYLWRMAIHHAQRFIHWVMSYEGMDIYVDFTTTCLDRLTYHMYEIMSEDYFVCCE